VLIYAFIAAGKYSTMKDIYNGWLGMRQKVQYFLEIAKPGFSI
jgi:hypothetical protein